MKFPRSQFPIFFIVFITLNLASPVVSSAALVSQGFTNLTGTAERMISYRHQERFLMTDDG